MKLFCTLIFFVFIVSSTVAQVTRTSSETIEAKRIDVVYLDLESDNIDIITTKSSRIVIERTVHLVEISNLALLDFIIRSGRYELEHKTDYTKNTLTIAQKKNQNILLVKGKEVEETISYKILLPEAVQYIYKKPTSTASIN